MEEKKDYRNIAIIIEGIAIIILIVLFISNKSSVNNDEETSLNTNTDTNTEQTSNNSDISVTKKENEEDIDMEIQYNETVSKENKYELTILGINFGKTILPPNTSGYYTYYEAKADGHQYLDVKYEYRNLETSNITSDDAVSMTIKYDDKYEYTGFCIIEDGDGDFTYANITDIAPLTSGKMHYLFDIPDEVANSSNSIVATIKAGSNTYKIKLR